MANVYPPEVMCLCGHRYGQHKPGGGPCWCLSELRCDCWDFTPAFEPVDPQPLEAA